MSNGQHLNRLANEKSPYLLQHAGNPVHWYPWGDEAFEKARAEHLPIFLSIGYSTCHWCHVMEEESFEDEEVAALLNEHFISIKVDREERPDIDHIYMAVCQAMTGSGGWPLTIIMTPDKEPFFAGTYFPKYDRGQRPGLMRVLTAISEAWDTDQERIRSTVANVHQYLVESTQTDGSGRPDEAIIETSFATMATRFDADFGGFGQAPKFPSPHNLVFLLRYSHYYQNKQALNMVETTLQKMRLGGIFDQIGFGFHRYSTDREWRVPHFEKMLYDQALLLQAYTETWEITRNPFYRDVADEIITYVFRDLSDENGGFYSAEDADSEGEEGKYYLWNTTELEKTLTEDEAQVAKQYFSFRKEGNFQEHPGTGFNGKNIPHLSSLPDHAIDSIREKLLRIRAQRVHPRRDDKILTDWNGLMIQSLAHAGLVLGKPEYIQAAQKAGDFIWLRMRTPDGHLYKSYRDGQAYGLGQLDDYVFMIRAYLELYIALQDVNYLQYANDLSRILKTEFSDESGGFFLNSSRGEALIVRPKTGYDGALPSGNSIAVENFYRLSHITGDMKWANEAENILMTFSDHLNQSPVAYLAMITGFMDHNFQSQEIIIVSDTQDSEAISRFASRLFQTYIPVPVLIWKTTANESVLLRLAPWLEPYKRVHEKTTYYICNNFICQQPTNNLEIALDYLHE